VATGWRDEVLWVRPFAAAVVAMFSLAGLANADEPPGPCAAPAAASVADRPGTGRTTSNGGAPCVVLQGDVVVEDGVRRQVTTEPGGVGADTLTSVNLAFVRVGIAKRLELGFTPPANEFRAASGASSFDTAHGTTDVAAALKYLVWDSPSVQASVGAAYSAPTGAGEFTAGAPTYATMANVAVALTPRLSLSTSLVLGTAVGPDAAQFNRAFFVFSPSVTLAYALDTVDTLLIQDAFTSRQGPVSPAGSRGFVALQRALGPRLALDAEFEMNLLPLAGRAARALGFGVVWYAHASHGG
jgi:hypothetical protein